MDQKIIIPRQILILAILAFVLNFIHLVWSDSIFALYIIWNIVLAFVPFLIAGYLLRRRKKGQGTFLFYLFGGALWLLFFPNAPYLVTDLIHVGESLGVPLWFDALTLFTSAWVGILLCFYTLSQVEELLLTKFSQKRTSIIILALILSASIGIYVGRFFRWNSWDIFIRSKKIFYDLGILVHNPNSLKEAFAFVLFFFVFILVAFKAWQYKENKQS